jgi:hypothetical protein
LSTFFAKNINGRALIKTKYYYSTLDIGILKGDLNRDKGEEYLLSKLNESK